MNRLPRATELAHTWVRERLRPGGSAIDATAGNGHDTEFLARLVGDEGRVTAYDVQAAAIDSTRARLEKAGLLDRVTLRQASHDRISEEGGFDVVMFNLGYCPGTDKTVITGAASTIRALAAAAKGLQPGGLITVVCYTGHPGGSEEAEAVLAWTRGLEPGRFRAMRCEMLVQMDPAPFLVAIERVG